MENKSNKGLIVLVLILIILVLGLSGYIVYDKVLLNDKEISNNIEDTTNKTEEKIVSQDIIDSLEKSLITTDNYFGLYSKDNISINTEKNDIFIRFNIHQYLIDNNVDFDSLLSHAISWGPEYKKENSYVINKSDLNLYIQNKWTTKTNYDMESSRIDYYGSNVIENTGSSFDIWSQPRGGAENYILNKYLKYEVENNMLYLYDNAVTCFRAEGSTYCYDGFENKQIYTCRWSETDSCRAKELVNYIFNNLNDKLSTFKHTFKLIDNKYYWQSSEPLN